MIFVNSNYRKITLDGLRLNTDFRSLGSQGPAVFPIALGCAAMSGTYGQTRNDAESISTIHEAMERGVNVLDTADFYGSGHNELLIGKVIQGRRDKVLLSVKFGALRSPDGGWVGLDSRPAAVKNFLCYTLNRLGVDYIDVYRPSRLDPDVPIEDTIGAIGDLCRSLTYHQLRRYEASTALACSGLRDPQCATSAQASCQLTLERAPTLDVERLVDGFVRDPHGRIIGEFTPQSLADLLRAPTLAPAAICTPPSQTCT